MFTKKQRLKRSGRDGGPIKTTAAIAHISATPDMYTGAVRKAFDEY